DERERAGAGCLERASGDDSRRIAVSPWQLDISFDAFVAERPGAQPTGGAERRRNGDRRLDGGPARTGSANVGSRNPTHRRAFRLRSSCRRRGYGLVEGGARGKR